MSTNDHTVPQMLLRRFARKVRKDGHMISAVPVTQPALAFLTNVRKVSAVNGFYWGIDEDGVPHHHWEQLLTHLEDEAAPILRRLLDHPQYALPPSGQWPLEPESRAALAWWMAAQLLRTTRQRKRLDATSDKEIPPSPKARDFGDNHEHLRFFVDHIAQLAAALYGRPWGLVFSDACLPTADVPVLIANAQDHAAPVLAASLCDVFMPLDPHRMLLLPNPEAVADDPRKQYDHKAKLDGGMGIFVTNMLYAAADKHLFHHPDHIPLLEDRFRTPRLPTPWEPDSNGTDITVSLSYRCLAPDYTVEARWLTQHPPRRQ